MSNAMLINISDNNKQVTKVSDETKIMRITK